MVEPLLGGLFSPISAFGQTWLGLIAITFFTCFLYSFGGALEFKLKGTPEFVWTVTKRKFTSAAEYLEGMLDMMDIMEDALET